MRALTLLCFILMAASPAHAELRDVRARLSGQEGLIWLAFDGQPTMLRHEATDEGLDLVIDGVSVASHTITPRDRELVTALQVEPTPTGARIRLQGHGSWAATEAELRQGGVLVRVHLDGSASSATRTASNYPAPDPAWTPTPTPAPVPASAASAAPASAPVQQAAATPMPAPAVHAAAEPETHAPAASSPDSPARASNVSARAATMAAASLPVDVSACATAAAAVQANPWDDAGLMRHAGCLARAGDAGQASRIYEQMLAFEPNDVTALMALADLRLQQGDRAAARTLYLRAAEHATSDSAALRARSQAEALRPQ
ncbi:tetratricopeptide repeat protein [uncultured Maricaulis sp.]|uniref:tetratricopeptide repeat protein n=1 Tax=uncultured Maricaulis sp. TaxID=174710 RepID=UPI0030DD3CE7|tara:strand:+ start:42768 stop:43715 length:948 start_codon:yes stop_codon:yes gene_type:complete